MAAAVSAPVFASYMTALPTDTLPAVEFLVRHMYRPIELGANRTHFAIAETAMPIGGDSWFWSDDNAKVLEFLSRPELWRRFPTRSRPFSEEASAVAAGSECRIGTVFHPYGRSPRHPSYSKRLLELQSRPDAAVTRRAAEFAQSVAALARPAAQQTIGRTGDETILRHQIARSITQREESVEIRTAVSSGETNSETQPWVMLGLFGHPAD